MLSRRGGFTLLELLLVVTVLSAVAWMSLGVVGNNADQVRFEGTRNRLQAIRRAIIGDTSRTINGQPEVRGYVADMGRLPENLQELTTQGSQPDYGKDEATKLWRGWNGPYLPPGFGATGSYLDGWGNNDGSSNFGWSLAFDTPNTGDLTVQSLGRDGAADGAEPELYDADYPAPDAAPLIDADEYQREIQTINVVFDFSNAPQCFQCVSPHTTQSACVANDGTWDDVITSYYTCSNPIYTNESDCESNDGSWGKVIKKCFYQDEVKCKSHHGTWKTIETYSCSDSTYITQIECESHGNGWENFSSQVCMFNSNHNCLADGGTWIEDADIISTDCKSMASKWRPDEQVCMSIAYISKGAIAVKTVGPVSISWNGARTTVPFDFGTDDSLCLGQAAYAITKGSTCPSTAAEVTNTNTFPSGSTLWTPFTYVPGTTLQPFERKINSY